MTGIENFGLYLFSAFIFTITPGLDTLLVLNRSLTGGRRAGTLSSIGISISIMCHTTLAAFGLSLLIAQSETAFAVLKYLGAAYLCYMGLSSIIPRKAGELTPQKPEEGPARDSGYYLFSGLTTNLLNPKVILFFLAFFPQFVSKGSLHAPAPYIILGLTYSVMSVIWLSFLSWFASSLANRLLHSRGFKVWMDRFSGLIFIIMGIKIALTEK